MACAANNYVGTKHPRIILYVVQSPCVQNREMNFFLPSLLCKPLPKTERYENKIGLLATAGFFVLGKDYSKFLFIYSGGTL